MGLEPAPVQRLDLHDGWTLRAGRGPVPTDLSSREVPASVPGCVHTDLLDADLIPDPYLDDNESATAWIGLTDWAYETTFDFAPTTGTRTELVFEGLDTIATVQLNDAELGRVDNMHRKWRFDVTDLLASGGNHLRVAFESPVRHAHAASLELGPRPHVEQVPYNAIRKLASSFGWDWGISTATSGIWRPVRLETWSARLADVRVEAAVDGSDGVLKVEANVQLVTPDASAAGLKLIVRIAGQRVEVPVDAETVKASVRVPDPALWWPVGYGEPNLHDVEIELVGASGVLDRTDRRVGFRTARWEVTPDADGTPFVLHVNDQPSYVKGVNWITDDCFPTRVDAARLARRLDQAVGANINLIRVWGGGLYESDEFYDACDERGLLTWQDMLFACAAYSEAEPLRSSIEAEVRENVGRIAHHASLVLLCGNNECRMGYEAWGWQDVLEGEAWGARYYDEWLPKWCAEVAPHVPYRAGSPWGPTDSQTNDPANGSCHLWELWNGKDWPEYRAVRPRFVAEFGWQGPPTWATLTEAVHDDPLTPESPWMRVHQKANHGLEKLTYGLLGHVRVPVDMDDWHWAMQHNQAAALRAALTHFRSLAPLNSGAVIWQLNDCWPVTSWALVDGAGRTKPVLYSVREAFAPRLVSIQPSDAGLNLVLGNDTAEDWSASVRLRRVDFAGAVLDEETIDLTVGPFGTATAALPAELATAGDAASELLVADSDGLRATWLFAEPRELALPNPTWQAELTRDTEGWALRVTPDAVALDTCLLVDKVAADAEVDDGLVTLLPGETHTFRITTTAEPTAEALTDPKVLRCLNQLVTK